MCRRLGVASAVTLLLASGIGSAALRVRQVDSPETATVAAIFPFWWSAEQAFLAAGSADATIVRTGALPTIVVVRSPKENVSGRLRAAGAWLVVDPIVLGGCRTGKAI